jgi:hypothetical protein
MRSSEGGVMKEGSAGGGRQRLQLDFSADAFRQLEEIRQLSRASSKAEVVRNALRLYEWYLKAVKQNHAKLQVVEGSSVKQVEIIF